MFRFVSFRIVLLFVSRGVLHPRITREIAFAKWKHKYIGGTSAAHGSEVRLPDTLSRQFVTKHLQRKIGTR